MIDRSEVGMLPISSLNAMEYCPRRFYYQFVQGEMLVNEFVLEGTLEHQRVHQAGTHGTGAEEIETTRLYLYSEALHLSGFADVIQERGGVFVPVEYKHGHLGEWINDHVQLCAQALCLEERMADQHESGRATDQHESGHMGQRESGHMGQHESGRLARLARTASINPDRSRRVASYADRKV